MATAYLCVLLAGLLPYVAAGIAKSGRGYDNRLPRRWLEAQTGYRQRAHHAQLNAFEAFPLFAASIVLSALASVSPVLVNVLASVFIVARVFHLAFYLADKPQLRSTAWVIGIACPIALLALAALRIHSP